jgi:hypothetical protein
MGVVRPQSLAVVGVEMVGRNFGSGLDVNAIAAPFARLAAVRAFD